MDMEITYGGLSSVPSDYEDADGMLAASTNMIAEEGRLKPIAAPAAVAKLFVPDRFDCIYIHKTPDFTHYIFRATGAKALFWVDSDDLPGDTNTMLLPQNLLIEMPLLTQVYDISSLGNIIVIASSDGVYYCAWDSGSYRALSGKPELFLEFGLEKLPLVIASESVTIETPLERDASGGTRYSDAAYANITNALYGYMLKTDAAFIKAGYFLMPFFVRYAFRLFDGSYCWHSSPVLMFPTAAPPKIIDDSDYDDTPSGTLAMQMKYEPTVTQLKFRYLSPLQDSDNSFSDHLKLWKSVVASVDVFVSAPIYTYDQSQNIPRRITTTWGDLSSRLYRSPFASDTVDTVSDSRTGAGSGSGNVRPGFSGSGNADTGFSDNVPGQFFIGRYGSSVFTDSRFSDIIGSKSDTTRVFDIPRNENFHKQVIDNSIFYKVASIPFDEIKLSQQFSALILDGQDMSDIGNDLSNLRARPTLPDDYQTHCTFYPKVLYTYNSRINMANVDLTPPVPLPIRALAPAGLVLDQTPLTGVSMRVWLKKNGITYMIESDASDADLASGYLSPFCYDSSQNHFPRWIFYPDSAACKMQITTALGETFTIPLSPHDFLNGAFYYGSFDVDPRPVEIAGKYQPDDDELSAPGIISRPDAIYTSEVNNPFFFPLNGINTVPAGAILGLASAARPLSQGQFGQFPLYAFTSEGVWAMEVSADGLYSARQPITRDVCINPKAITPIDSAVLFPTARGIMLIAGSQTSSISDVINSDFPFDLTGLPAMDKIHALAGHDISDSCFPLIPFRQFLNSCNMIYDYVHQHIIVYNAGCSYAYVFSLRSTRWGIVHADLRSHPQSYPDAIAMTHSGLLVDYAARTGDTVSGIVVTRPLKLDAPDVLKTVTSVIQRGNFRKGHVQSALYGSRDLFSWHLVWSSKDHFMRGFRGTPYKYFRIALLCSLSPDESIFGASLRFTPRLTNQPR